MTVTEFLRELHPPTQTHGNSEKVFIARKDSLIQNPVTFRITQHVLFLVISPRNAINSCAVSSGERHECCVTALTAVPRGTRKPA